MLFKQPVLLAWNQMPEWDRHRPEQRTSCRWGGWRQCLVLTLLLYLLLDSSVTWPSGEACCSGWCSSVSTRPSGPRFPSRQTCWGRSVRTLGRTVSCSARRPAVAGAAACCFLNAQCLEWNCALVRAPVLHFNLFFFLIPAFIWLNLLIRRALFLPTSDIIHDYRRCGYCMTILSSLGQQQD